ncbi:hypothetical protein X971_3944 [Agrobacterium tumefaciens LBA4213 (Ach5)]|nr:hypothetical protein X971_3944 [Agrobacterium tumefaciens LBA4213 (Ach5)]
MGKRLAEKTHGAKTPQLLRVRDDHISSRQRSRHGPHP